MDNYKAQTTLNERDSLMDLLCAQKSLVKVYAEMLTEGVSKGFRKTVIDCLDRAIKTQFDTFMLLTELDYIRVESAKDEEVQKAKEKYGQILNRLN